MEKKEFSMLLMKSFGVCIINYEQVQLRVNAKYDTWQRGIMNRFGVKLSLVEEDACSNSQGQE